MAVPIVQKTESCVGTITLSPLPLVSSMSDEVDPAFIQQFTEETLIQNYLICFILTALVYDTGKAESCHAIPF